MRMRLAMSLFTVTMISACQKSSEGGTSTGNPLISFKMTASSSLANTIASYTSRFPWLNLLLRPALALPPPPAMTDANGLSVTLDHAWITVKEIEFKATEVADQDEVDGEDVSLEGPFVVDLFSSQPEVLGQARIGTSLVRRVKMQLHNASTLPVGAPVQMLDKSLYWSGTVNGHSLVITSREGYEFELGGQNGVGISESANMLMSIRVANLFKKINLSAVVSDSVIDEQNRLPAVDPCPLIDASASDIYTCFTKGLETESNLGVDSDNDDELSGDDDTVK